MSKIFDLHCATPSPACKAPGRCRTPSTTPRRRFPSPASPRVTNWAQCCAIFVPDELGEEESLAFFRTHVESFRRQTALFEELADCVPHCLSEAERGLGAGQDRPLPHGRERLCAGP